LYEPYIEGRARPRSVAAIWDPARALVGALIERLKARDHDITKVAPAFWALPVLEKTPSAPSIDRSVELFFPMLRSDNRGLHVRGPFRFRQSPRAKK
jgi:hypothetical protein